MTGYTDPTQHLFWLGSRATGIVAMLLVAVSVGIGLAMSSKLVRVPGMPPRLKALHEALALTSIGAIAAHGFLLLGDSYLHPNVGEIVLPFAMHGQPVWTGLGVIGGWLAVILGLSFYVRRRIGTKVWRWLHRWTLLVYVLGVAHTLGSGTDAGSAWLLAILAATAVPIVFLATYRFLPGSSRRPRPISSGPQAPRPSREEVMTDEVPATG